jgi:hypothetical protein
MRAFLNAIRNSPHAEERLTGASRSTHDAFAADIPAFPRFLKTLRIVHELLPAATPSRDHRLHPPAGPLSQSRPSAWADANRDRVASNAGIADVLSFIGPKAPSVAGYG